MNREQFLTQLETGITNPDGVLAAMNRFPKSLEFFHNKYHDVVEDILPGLALFIWSRVVHGNFERTSDEQLLSKFKYEFKLWEYPISRSSDGEIFHDLACLLARSFTWDTIMDLAREESSVWRSLHEACQLRGTHPIPGRSRLRAVANLFENLPTFKRVNECIPLHVIFDIAPEKELPGLLTEEKLCI
jgi:hypothetical protein